MGLINVKANEVIHKKGDCVKTIEIVVKGKVSVNSDESSIIMEAGGIIGTIEHPGQNYFYTYTAIVDSTVFSYPYTCNEDIAKVVSANPKICNILASQSMKSIIDSLEQVSKDYALAKAEYDMLQEDIKNYPKMAITVGCEIETFPELENLEPPVKIRALSEWQENFYRDLYNNEDVLKKHIYPLSPNIANGFILFNIESLRYVSACCEQLSEYRRELAKKASRFTSNLHLIKAKSDDLERNGAGGQASAIDIKNALNTILHYAQADKEITDRFREAVTEFKSMPGRYESTEEYRLIRKQISQDFYPIYISAFLRSLDDPMIPSEVMMFLMFGFVDEDLAGLENTRQLYLFMKTYTPDPDGFVLNSYEWLKKIYDLEVEPSKNEFDEDYFTALRTMKTNGDINEIQHDMMVNDPLERLKFEVKNLLALGNRMTFGRASTFVPVFDALNVIRPLETSYIDFQKIHDFYDHIRSIDYSVFCRQGFYSNPEVGINKIIIDEDITPYCILMPNIGSRASVWQEIEGKKRNTPARMVISIFHTESLDDVLIKVCGEFRWEMCKTEQGVHWNDVTDPSLTSLYCDYLQFYKKNHYLSTDTKEKIKTALQKYNNNYKKVFIADYYNYIKYEANTSPRLNKVSREILFTFCPFGKELREKLRESPTYSELMKKHIAQVGNQLRPLSNTIKRIRSEGFEIPDELMTQFDFFQK